MKPPPPAPPAAPASPTDELQALGPTERARLVRVLARLLLEQREDQRRTDRQRTLR